MISDIRTVCPLLVLARSQQNIPFYVVTQTRGENKLADVSSDVEGIFARYTIEDSPQRRYVDSIRQLFFYYVYHGKVSILYNLPNSSNFTDILFSFFIGHGIHST